MTSIAWFTNDDAAKAVELAAREQKPLVVDLWSPTCSGCAKLFLKTYPDERVRRLADTFVWVKYDTTKPNEWFRKLNGAFGHHWHPHIIVMDHHLTTVRRFIGYLPPGEFVAQLELGHGQLHLFHRRAKEALSVFEGVLNRDPRGASAPEALYWAGVAASRVGGGMETLAQYWNRLPVEYPGNEWTARADCLDVVLPEGGFSVEAAIEGTPRPT